jgi:DNA repair protein REV1
MHVDMDCFFASVSVRNRPELLGVPLAVAHSAHAAGHSELSCVNYVARQAGVRADMWLAGAKAQCASIPLSS